MKISAAIAKTPKYAVSTSGDSGEVVERPLGGLSVLVVDGQGSGRPAKTLSSTLAGRAAALINEGIRDGAVARAIHDWLFAQKNGRVSATISILSIATDTDTLVITRSGNCPILVYSPTKNYCFDNATDPLGFYRYSRPQVEQIDLEPGLVAVAFSDGILHSGSRQNNNWPVKQWQEKIAEFCRTNLEPEFIAEKVLSEALSLDDGRPGDDMSVAVLAVVDRPADGISRVQLECPVKL